MAPDLLRAVTLGDVLDEHRRSRPRALATVDGRARLTYPELSDEVAGTAAALAAAGVGDGDRVVWIGRNSARVLVLLLAAAATGASCCPANWRSSAEELAFVLDDLAPAVVAWDATGSLGDRVRDARGRARPGRARWVSQGTGADDPEGWVAFLAEGRTHRPRARAPAPGAADPAAPVALLYTAAFGGRPAAAMLDHTCLLTQSLLLARAAEIDDSTRTLACGPLFHAVTLGQVVATFAAGGTNVFTPRADPEEICRLVEAERCTRAFLTAPTIDRIVELNRGGRYDLSSLRAFRGGPEWNAMITVDDSPWARRPGGYGQTEVGGMLTANLTGDATIGSHGRPPAIVGLRIVDPADREVPDGETGELVVRGPVVMRGYWNRPEENERRFRGGWYHTNDLARREADGTITFVGPKTRLVKCGLENVYPVEVEQCIASHPGVAACAVIGTPDPRWGQAVVAIVVPTPGLEIDAESVIEHCRARMASYKKPRRVEIVDELPRRGLAVDYAALDARFGGGGYPGAGREAG